MKPKLKPPETKRLKLEYDGLLSNFGFKFSLRRYSVGEEIAAPVRCVRGHRAARGGVCESVRIRPNPTLYRIRPNPNPCL
jgi:hypothetical protein